MSGSRRHRSANSRFLVSQFPHLTQDEYKAFNTAFTPPTTSGRLHRSLLLVLVDKSPQQLEDIHSFVSVSGAALALLSAVDRIRSLVYMKKISAEGAQVAKPDTPSKEEETPSEVEPTKPAPAEPAPVEPIQVIEDEGDDSEEDEPIEDDQAAPLMQQLKDLTVQTEHIKKNMLSSADVEELKEMMLASEKKNQKAIERLGEASQALAKNVIKLSELLPERFLAAPISRMPVPPAGRPQESHSLKVPSHNLSIPSTMPVLNAGGIGGMPYDTNPFGTELPKIKLRPAPNRVKKH